MTALEIHPVDADDELDAYLGYLASLDEQASTGLYAIENEPAAPTIADLDRAGRALRRLAYLDARMAEIDAVYEQRLAELDAWREGERRRDEHVRSFLLGRLRQFHEARLAEDPKAKTIRLPEGDLKSRMGQPRWEIDDQALIAWAADHMDELLRRDPKVDRTAVKLEFRDRVTEDGRVFDDAGEVVPGIIVRFAEVAYTAAPNPIGEKP